MADTDFPLEDVRVRDESTYQRDGTIARQRVYVFYLGKQGPFTERVPLQPFDDFEFDRRVTALRSHLQAIHR